MLIVRICPQDAMMQEADRNGDGQIDYAEFVQAIIRSETDMTDETEMFVMQEMPRARSRPSGQEKKPPSRHTRRLQ